MTRQHPDIKHGLLLMSASELKLLKMSFETKRLVNNSQSLGHFTFSVKTLIDSSANGWSSVALSRTNHATNPTEQQEASGSPEPWASSRTSSHDSSTLAPVGDASLAFSGHKGKLAPTCHIWVDSRAEWKNKLTHFLKRVKNGRRCAAENRCSVCASALCHFCVNILALFVHCRGVQIPANASKWSPVSNQSEMQHWPIERDAAYEADGEESGDYRFYLRFSSYRVGGWPVPGQISPQFPAQVAVSPSRGSRAGGSLKDYEEQKSSDTARFHQHSGESCEETLSIQLILTAAQYTDTVTFFN